MTNIADRIHRGQTGITGLETAIILIAFIVVASVFAYTVLSAGLFSAQKTEEVTHSGISEAESTMMIMGNVIAFKGTAGGDECITKLLFTVGKALPAGGGAIDLTPLYRVDDTTGALVSPIISDCNTTWTAASGTGVSVSADASDYKESPRSAKIVVASASGSNTALAYYNLPDTMDLTYASQIGVWIKSSEQRDAGDIQLVLCSGSNAANIVETVTMPALPGDAWMEAIVDINSVGGGSISAINSIGLQSNASLTNITIHLDEVRTRTGASNDNVAMIAYNDSHTFIDNVAWTVEFEGGYGGGTGDYLLENSERATITVWLQDFDGMNWTNGSGYNDPFIDSNGAHLKSSSEFNIQIMPPSGATLLIKKRTPAYLHEIMRLL